MENIFINHWAVLVSAVFSLVLGGLWYSRALFGNAWQKENKLTDEQLQSANPAKTYGLGFLLAYVMSYNLAFFLGEESTTWQWGLAAGFLAGFGWAAAMFTVIALFEQKTWRYILINAGYIVIYFTVIGFILGAWR